MNQLRDRLSWALTDRTAALRALSDVELGIGDPDPVQDFSGIAHSNRTMVAALLAQ